MEHLTLKATTTVDAGVDTGEFSALVAAFNNVDRGGDVIRPGAFKNTLARWRSSGKRIPVVWSHQSSDPSKVIGDVDPADAYETDKGLVVNGQLDLSSSTAREVLRLLKSGDVSGWSFGYAVPPDGQRVVDGNTEITEIDLLELGPTPIPMNDEARTLAAKSTDDDPFAAFLRATTPRRRRFRLEDLEDPEPSMEERAAAKAKRLRTPITIKPFEID